MCGGLTSLHRPGRTYTHIQQGAFECPAKKVSEAAWLMHDPPARTHTHPRSHRHKNQSIPNPTQATAVAPDATSGLCTCAAGWTGPDCGVCTEDAAVRQRLPAVWSTIHLPLISLAIWTEPTGRTTPYIYLTKPYLIPSYYSARR